MRLKPDNPMNRAVLSVLIFEVIVFWLGFPGMIMLDDVALVPALVAVSVASLLAIVSAVLLKRPAGYPLGWLTQLVGISLGFLTPMMFAAAGIFALIWVTCIVLGRKIENTPRPQS